jgi:signal transduction histidine kinase
MLPSKTTCLISLFCLFFETVNLQAADKTRNVFDKDSINRVLKELPDSAKFTKLMVLSDQVQQQNITESLELARLALEFAESSGNTGLMGTANLKIAELYWFKGIYDKSLAYVLEALKLFEKTGMEKETAYGCEVAGKIYKVTDNPLQAVDYYKKALDINLRLHQVPEVARIYTSMGSAYVNMDSIDKGLSYYLVAFMIIDSLGMETEKNDLLIQLGDGYFRLNKYEESLKNYYQAAALAEKTGNLFIQAQAKSRIGITYLQMKNLPAAKKYAQESLLLAEKIKTFRITGESYKTLAEIYAAEQDYKKAFENYMLYKEASDSLLNEEKIRQIGELQAKYDMSQKEQEIEWLKEQNINKTRTIKRITLASSMIALLLVFSLIQLFLLIRLYRRTRQLNLKLAKQSKELEDLNDQKDKFFSFVAHNLKNPFSTIMGFSELIAKNSHTKEYDKLDRYAKHILGLSVHVHKILENLLEWSRIQRRSFEYRPENTDVAALISDVLEMNQKEAERKEIALTYDLPQNLMSFTDKFMVTTILQNLMSNALNFTPSSGKIHVSAKTDGSKVTVSITDTGIGIAKDDLPKLFRIDVHPVKIGTAESKGAGLGLVICKELIQRCQGDITIESQLSRGTTVIFTLPVKDSNLQADESKAISEPDVMVELKKDMEKIGQLPEEFVQLCKNTLIPGYNEVRSVLSLDRLNKFARDVEAAGMQYNIMSFVYFGHHLLTLLHTHQIDKILRFLPEFKKMTDVFVV